MNDNGYARRPPTDRTKDISGTDLVELEIYTFGPTCEQLVWKVHPRKDVEVRKECLCVLYTGSAFQFLTITPDNVFEVLSVPFTYFADTCDRCTRSLTLTWYVPDHDLCWKCYAKENSSAPWYAYDTPVQEVRCNGCGIMVDEIKYTPASNLCHSCFSQSDDIEHAPYRLTNSASFPLQPGSPVSSCRLEQSCSSSWSCDECKFQLTGTWFRPDFDLCYACYKKKLPTTERWFAYEGAQSSETQCDECKLIITGVKYTVSYDICQPCAEIKPFYSPFRCNYRPTTSNSCPDAVGAIVLRFWPAPALDHKLAGVPTPHLVLVATHYASHARNSSFKIYNDVVEVGRDLTTTMGYIAVQHSCLSLAARLRGLRKHSQRTKDKRMLRKVEDELKVREAHFHDPDCQFPLMGGVQHAAKAFLSTIDGQQLVNDLLES